MKTSFCYMEKFKVLFLRTLQQTILILAYSSLTLTMDTASFSETHVGLYFPMCTASYIRMYFNKETVGEHPVHIPDNKEIF